MNGILASQQGSSRWWTSWLGIKLVQLDAGINHILHIWWYDISIIPRHIIISYEKMKIELKICLTAIYFSIFSPFFFVICSLKSNSHEQLETCYDYKMGWPIVRLCSIELSLLLTCVAFGAYHVFFTTCSLCMILH